MTKYLDTLGVRASIVVQSHCSDMEMELSTEPLKVKARLGFIKFIINKLSGNLDQYIDVDLMWSDYVEYYDVKF
jgi:hypothetical protein